MMEINSKTKSKKTIIIASIIAIIALVAFIGIIIYYNSDSAAVNATKAYNKAIEEYNSALDKYNETIKNSSVDNLEGCYAPADKLSTVSEERAEVKKSLEAGNSIASIKKDTDTVKSWTEDLNNSIKIAEQLRCPDASWIESRIRLNGKINDTGIVTDESQIDNYMGQNSGCVSVVYFGVEYIEPNSVEGSNIIEKGTDAGGSIEVYKDLESAVNRCEYLKGFDNTYLYSGSFAIVGTTVVRTSYRLESEQQLEITSWIFEQLSRIE